MGIKLIYIYIILAIVSCDATKKTINICNRKYTVYKHNSYLHEEDLNATFHTICFPNSRYSLFSYLVSGKRNDSNLVSTQLKYSGDTLIINTVYDKKVYHEEHDYISKDIIGVFQMVLCRCQIIMWNQTLLSPLIQLKNTI